MHSNSVADQRVSPQVIITRVAVIIVLIPVLSFYLVPRVVGLINLPAELDKSVASAQRYNPALGVIVAHERKTVEAFDVLDRMQSCLTRVQQYDATIAAELTVLITRIRTDVSDTLAQSEVNLDGLLGDLDGLVAQVDALHQPASDVDGAVEANRKTLDSVLTSVRKTADRVERASDSARSVAGHLSGDAQ